MNRVLIITHAASEGPGSLGAFLPRCGAEIHMVSLENGERLPESTREVHAVVIMGGPMSVHDETRYPFLRDELAWLGRAIELNIPVLGICLGAQLIARACGAEVMKAPRSELGWSQVQITDEGRRDILFQGISSVMPVFQWHEETFDIPEGGMLLAMGKECRHQAFRYRNAYGLQFHPEVTEDMIAEWMEQSPTLREMLRTFHGIEREYQLQARTMYTNFMWLADIRRRVAERSPVTDAKEVKKNVRNRGDNQYRRHPD